MAAECPELSEIAIVADDAQLAAELSCCLEELPVDLRALHGDPLVWGKDRMGAVCSRRCAPGGHCLYCRAFDANQAWR